MTYTFSCQAIIHNAIIAWNLQQIPLMVTKLRFEGNQIENAILRHITSLIWKHIDPFGRYYFNTERTTRL